MFTIQQQIAAWAEWAAITAAMNFLLLKWLSGVGHDDDEEELIVEAHELVTSTLGDADKCRAIECITGKDLRSQLSVQQAMALEETAKLLKMKGERN